MQRLDLGDGFFHVLSCNSAHHQRVEAEEYQNGHQKLKLHHSPRALAHEYTPVLAQ